LSLLASFLTALYSCKLIFYVFISYPNSFKGLYRSSKEASVFLVVPVLCLGVLSIFSGYFLKDLMIGTGSLFFSDTVHIQLSHDLQDSEYMDRSLKMYP